MKLSAIILSNVLLASGVLAAPRGVESRVERRATRTTGTRSSHPMIPVKGDTNGGINASQITYSSNWAGAVITAPPAGETFTSVSAKFVIPKPSNPSGTSGMTSASAWVGIDGDTYGAAILQAGVDFTSTNGAVSLDAWYEWYPNYAIDFTGFGMSVGDTISVSVTSSDNSNGVVVMENVSTGQTLNQAVSAPSSSSVLGGQNAEWIVEDFEENGGLVPLTNFGTVTFNSCVAKTNGATMGAGTAGIIEIQGKTDVSIPADSQVVVTWT